MIANRVRERIVCRAYSSVSHDRRYEKRRASPLLAVVILLAVSAFVPARAFPDVASVTLDWCQEKARENYPLTRQRGIIADIEQYSLKAAIAGYFPRLTLSGKATEQSDATALSIPQIGISIEPTTEQYQAVVEASQTIWDGNLAGTQRKIAKASAEVDRKKLESDLYALRDRVDQIYFAILLFDGQLAQNDLLRADLAANERRVRACVENGIANGADLDAIRIEELNAEQSRISITYGQKSYRAVLSRIVGVELGAGTEFVRPEAIVHSDSADAGIERPEYALFDAQSLLLTTQRGLALAAVQPRLSLFVQAGYGQPALNMLNADPDTFWIGGVRLSWSLDSFYTLRSNLGKIAADADSLRVQRDLFAYNQDVTSVGQSDEIEKLSALLASDAEIVSLRVSLKRTAETRVENGTVSVSELVRAIDEESIARAAKSVREIQLLAAEYNLAFTKGN